MVNFSIYFFILHRSIPTFQPTYYSGFSAFFQLSKEDKNRPLKRFYFPMSMKFPLKSDNDNAKEENCKDED